LDQVRIGSGQNRVFKKSIPELEDKYIPIGIGASRTALDLNEEKGRGWVRAMVQKFNSIPVLEV